MIARYITTTLLVFPLLATAIVAQQAPSGPTAERVDRHRLTSPAYKAKAMVEMQRTTNVRQQNRRTHVSPAVDPQRNMLAKLGPGDSIGYTYYDLATNSGVTDRVVNWPNNKKPLELINSSAVWTASVDPPPPTNAYAATTRGTYGAFQSGESWSPMTGTWKRLEGDLRTGFVELAALSDGRLVMANHSADKIHVYIELEPHTYDFFQQEIVGSELGLWPSLAVSEDDDIHIIWRQTDNAVIRYSRSIDKGNSFSEAVELTGPGSVLGFDLVNTASANSYVIAARGDKVAIWYVTTGIDQIEIVSYDQGETWLRNDLVVLMSSANKRVYFEHDDRDSVYQPDPSFGLDTIGYRSDTVISGGMSIDMIMDSEGNTHGVIPFIVTYVTRWFLDTDTSVVLPGSATIWAADLKLTDAGMRYIKHMGDTLYSSTIANPGGMNNEENPDAPGYYGGRDYHGGWSYYPQLGIDASNNVYCAFISGVDGDVQMQRYHAGDPELPYLFSHVWLTWMQAEDPQRTWSPAWKLTPNGMDAKYASVADLVDDEIHIIYQIDPIVGGFITDTLAAIPRDKSNIEVLMLPQRAIVSAREEVASNAVLTASPNPAVGHMNITFAVEGMGRTSLVLVDAMGRIARTIVDEVEAPRGRQHRTLNVDGLANGVYFLRLMNGGVMTTTAVNITH